MAHHDTESDRPLNAYEQKLETRRERYLELADKADAESLNRSQSATGRLSAIPMGQPILVGHHSERRHRRDIARSEKDMRKAVDAADKAGYYRNKAASVGTGGVSADDPDAITKLEAERTARLNHQTKWKKLNAIWRQYKRDPESPKVAKKLDALSPDERAIITSFTPNYSWERGPVAAYTLTNNNAAIKRLTKRIDELKSRAEYTPADAIEGDGYTLIENVDANRIQFHFDGKPSSEVRALLKSHAFKWAPSESAWQRQLNNAGIYAARRVHQAIIDGAAQ